jgi:hypothetical protein
MLARAASLAFSLRCRFQAITILNSAGQQVRRIRAQRAFLNPYIST